ncbi:MULTISPECIES: RNA-guided endonuclease IscB [Okeania]|uniref:HNH endonuclease n=2 Tax=Okeania TaxID=1458928 RepID=A0A3N6Q1F1_9CYAN|nr:MULTISPECIES: RNA-guided endonuclease IscB [Okeania]NET76476.1 HNH endonuclease [Okeania sp. SIO1F9]RQH08830.1 HNH endonuclease [Okeania hirsuta]RQH44545.1 HNH endonuclease [Okeania hirsuta]
MSNSTNYVFVLDAKKKPLAPCKPAMARSLLKAGKAKVFKRYPFTIILKKLVALDFQGLQLKIDPGSKQTGFALVTQSEEVIFAMVLVHRGQQIKNALERRRTLRRGRRYRKTRYRKCRFFNRKRKKGWLPPSLRHRVLTVETWVNRLCKLSPVSSLAIELVKFDTQKIQNPEISGVEYQKGELFGYDVREYLLEKWGRSCAYCGATDTPLEIEHIVPRSKGGSNRVSNLAIACHQCNQNKGAMDIREFLENKPSILAHVLKVAKTPLKDAAAVNSTRTQIFETLTATGLPVITGSGAGTKYNRRRLNLPKEHWIDAACIGEVEKLTILTNQPLVVTAMGHGCRQMVQMDKYGFPRIGYKAKKPVPGWKTGDIINVVKGKNAGLKGVRIKTVRSKGNFDIRQGDKILSVSRNHIQPVHRRDGYNYSF